MNCKVKFLNLKRLQASLDLVAKGLNGKVGKEITDYYGKTQSVELSITTTNYRRGIGFVKQGNEYVAKTDAYGQESAKADVMREIIQRYQQASVTNSLRQQGYMLGKVTETAAHVLLVPARRY